MIRRFIFIRDGRLSRTAKIVLAILALFVLAATLPMRLALAVADPDGGTLSAREVYGSVWDGGARGLQLGRLPIGDVEMAVRLFPLLTGRTEFALKRLESSRSAGLIARVSGGDNRFAMHDTSGELPVSGALAPLPVRAIRFVNFSYAVEGGRCTQASGTVGLVIPAFGPVLPGDTALSGEARCEDGSLVVPMAGPTGNERLMFRLAPQGEWSADLVMTGLPPEVSAPLIEMGFARQRQGIGLSASGAF